jgi:WD40 repeat protein/serine/threonine protein kinase
MSEPGDDTRAIFHAALAFADPAKRAEYLRVACGQDADLRQQVDSLLAAHDRSGNFMQAPALGGHEVKRLSPEETEASQVIGNYRLLQKIGEGGFGVVYMAEQERPIVRKVALKIIKLGMDTKQVIARFEAERQALALMDHPNIAKVLDAGATETGRPYFVMELVCGIPVLKYCDEKRLPNEQRLRIFMDICDGIQHAHQKGIIHRDIKPTNVLVTLLDGKPVPKVIDFGIAKATQQRLTDKTLFTRVEQFIGTPSYMSPEQAEMSGMDIDTRTDIYSLGVLLYELLTGCPPFDPKDFSRGGYDEIRRRIREDEPPTPSTRLSSLTHDDLTTIASDRRSDPVSLRALLRGDQDWIVMKAMEKERTRRYDSASALAEDLGRYLRHEPVSAVPPSRLYKLQKFARRNRGVLAATGTVASLLVLAATISIWQAVRATVARGRESAALQSARRAEQDAMEKARSAQLNLYVSDMNLAHEAYREGNLQRAIDLLSRHAAADRREMPFEWRHLWKICQQGDALGTRRHSSAFTSLAFSRDGTIAAGSDDGSVRLFQSDLKSELMALDAQAGVVSVVFSSDGTKLVAATEHGDVKLWNTRTWENAITLPNAAPQKTSARVAFSPDAGKLAAASRSFGLRLWSARELAEVKTFPVVDSPAYEPRTVAYSPVGNVVATTGPGLSVRLWDADQLQELPPIDEAHTSYASAVAFSPDGTVLATGSWDTMVKLWDVHTRRHLATLIGHQAEVTSLSFSPDGERLASSSKDATVKLWRVGRWIARDGATIPSSTSAATPAEAVRQPRSSVWTIAPYATLRGHTQPVQCVTFSPDGNLLASAGSDGTLKLWPPDGPRQADVLVGHEDWPYCVAFSPDDQTLATGSFGGMVGLWDVVTCRLKEPPWQAHRFDVFKVAFSRDGNWLASCDSVWRVTTGRSADSPGEVKLWNLPARRETNIPGVSTGIRALALSPDGTLMAIGDRHGRLRLWDRRTSEYIADTTIEDRLEAIRFSPDGRTIATTGPAATKLWSVPTCQQRHSFDVGGFDVAFSADGQMLAAGCTPAVSVFSAATYQLLAVLEGHKTQVLGIAFSPDGRTLATGSVDHTVKLWNIEAGREVATLRGHQGPVSCVTFSHDGNTLASSSEDNTVRLWRTDWADE